MEAPASCVRKGSISLSVEEKLSEVRPAILSFTDEIPVPKSTVAVGRAPEEGAKALALVMAVAAIRMAVFIFGIYRILVL